MNAARGLPMRDSILFGPWPQLVVVVVMVVMSKGLRHLKESFRQILYYDDDNDNSYIFIGFT